MIPAAQARIEQRVCNAGCDLALPMTQAAGVAFGIVDEKQCPGTELNRRHADFQCPGNSVLSRTNMRAEQPVRKP